MTERWLLLAYSCSGFAGLVYEIAWTRLLTLHLGHTTAAVSTRRLTQPCRSSQVSFDA
jgi:hypothetical protein